ncbi:MAG: 3-deoxy-7-phosphoheptulonate synthase [Ignavibacteria bacterium GWA2_55_11]|nr:MAG: 3-deoxy-7-phosphoheptulonate synthase [Ignavibacteria bacterium GWA2_55_11]OGU63616.1 MAG: 3-deoxy-7-phosphoheptulonate synthase [Ignavibacteria bacterium RIFCSPHIGHO2_02_FULL_56_12]OGU73213.1 MAG: 3-deoxy-7-phosphoheptulonate synthase [Ignavibacteria bacterium RIFCSPLOWO2_02_FULL_55_14]OGU74593.1 MAG: 3-deoxy-7-phosphoheptulonate synthase [Ignavibacteria bacterium RIFCSPLOWO2_12_FULL_56_21]HAV23446.1 3-deoxy-7-phosphoheptulonate synthase [Bacteroidota bacterium]
MLIVMKSEAAQNDVERVKEKVRSLGFVPHEIPGAQRVAIGITGNKGGLDPNLFLSMNGVQDAVSVSKPFKLVSREVKQEDTVIDVGADRIGGRELTVIAGPCSVESRQQILETAEILRDMGVRFLRGGAFKPRTSPYAFQGLKIEGLEFLKEAAERTGLHVVTEVKDTETIAAVSECSDILQVGARNMYNFSLLERLGELRKPVLLKRSFAATVEELLMAAEYLASRGNYNIILCERGIRTYETYTRNTLDLNAVPLLKSLSHLPVFVDPSHGTGRWDLITPMALAAVVAGADGVIVEVHPDPAAALSDGFQSLRPDKFRTLLARLQELAPFAGRQLTLAPSFKISATN